MPSRRVALALFAMLLCVAPAAAAPPPQSVSGFDDGFGSEGYGPDYPSTNVSNVSVDVEVASNGTARWTERATLTNPETVDAFRGNESLRRAAVEYTFDYRFDDHVTALRSELADDTLLVTYHTDEGIERGPGGGVIFAPFASYGNDYYPGVADVTFHPPEGYAVVDAPEAFARSGDTLRWNSTTGPGDASGSADARPTSSGVSPGIVTFAPADAALPGVLAWVATLVVFGVPTVGVAAGHALLLGLPLGLVLSGAAALGWDAWERWALLAPVAVVFVAAAVVFFPATGPGLLHPFAWVFVLPGAGVVSLFGLALHALARW